MALITEFVARLCAPEVVRQIMSSRMTYLSCRKLNSLHRLVQQTFSAFENPLFAEFGVALGGSAAIMVKEIQNRNRGMFLGYDMFGMIPPPSEKDRIDSHRRYNVIVSGAAAGLQGDKYYGYEEDLLSKVLDNFLKVGIDVCRQDYKLIRGDFRSAFVKPEVQMSLMHIDCDWHDSVTFCLEKALEHLAPGGVVIVDDYNNYRGCRDAVDGFLQANGNRFEILRHKPHFVMTRKGRQRMSPVPVHRSKMQNTTA